MDIETDGVPGAVAKPLPIPSRLVHLAAGAIDLARGDAGACGVDAGGLRCDDEFVDAPELGIRFAHEDGAAEVRAVAIDDGAKVERDRGALADGVSGQPGAGVSLIEAPGRDDAGVERFDARAASRHLEVHLRREFGLGHAGKHLRADHRHHLIDDARRHRHPLHLLWRLDPAKWTEQVDAGLPHPVPDLPSSPRVVEHDSCTLVRMRGARLGPLTAGLAVLLAACGGSSSANSPTTGSTIVFGAAVSLTGAQAKEGGLTKQGYDLWLDWINARGGIVVSNVKHR